MAQIPATVENPIGTYTAAQIARAAGVSKRAVLAALAGISPSSSATVNGKAAPAWPWEILPAKIQSGIQSVAGVNGWNVHTFLCSAPGEWKHALPLRDIDEGFVRKAEKLRRALARALDLHDSPAIPPETLEAYGLEDYHREFSHTITPRHFWALLDRTLERDRGYNNFSRLEIYLDGNARRKATPDAIARAAQAAPQFKMLHDTMAGFRSATAPSSRERESLWLAAVEYFQGEILNGENERRTRIALVNFLWDSAPWLATTKQSLRTNFKIKLKRWLASPQKQSALRDGREAKKGIPTKAPIPQELVDLVVSCGTFGTGGRVSQAVREVADNANRLGISPDLADLLTPDTADKSFVNHRLRQAVTPQIEMLAPYVIGSRALDTARASLDRDYSKIPSGYCVSADDVTLPVYWHVPDGNGWYNLVRGQCIVVIDVRSLKVLGWSLQPDRNYSSPVIHTVMSKVFAAWGVPKLLYFEKGIWENSKLITGGASSKTSHPDYEFMPFSWAETERGFSDLGVKFIHAIRARSKVVERVIGLLQDRMEAEPGYCGRDERRDCPAETKRRMDDVKFRRVQPAQHFYDFGQWETRLGEIIRAYNATVQQGKILQGLSPDAAQEKLQSTDPDKLPLFFDETCRHLLAHYRVAKEPGRDGITIRIGKKKWVYRNKRLSEDKFKKVLCWFNPDDPELLAVTDMNHRNPYSVPLSNSVDALDPDADALATELARVADYESFGKARFQILKATYAPKFRRVVPTRPVVETGQQIAQQREAFHVERKNDASRQARVKKKAETLGFDARLMADNPDAETGLSLMREAQLAHDRKLKTETSENL